MKYKAEAVRNVIASKHFMFHTQGNKLVGNLMTEKLDYSAKRWR